MRPFCYGRRDVSKSSLIIEMDKTQSQIQTRTGIKKGGRKIKKGIRRNKNVTIIDQCE
jgi:hypothetical protein